MSKERTFSIDGPVDGVGPFQAQPHVLLQRDNEDALKDDLLKSIGNQKKTLTREEVITDHPEQEADEKEIPQYPLSRSVSFQRVSFQGTPQADKEIPEICRLLQRARALRKKWMYSVCTPPQKNWGGMRQELFEIGMMTPAAIRAGSNSRSSMTCKSPSKRRRPEMLYTVGNASDAESTTAVPHSGHTFHMHNGIVVVCEEAAGADQAGKKTAKRARVESSGAEGGAVCFGGEYSDSLSIVDFYKDLSELQSIINNGPIKSFTFRQLEQLKARFQLHCQLNGQLELAEQKSVPHRDFYNVRKVDTHVHHSACMHQKHLLRFIKSKLKKSPDDEVLLDKKSGKVLSLIQVFQQLKLTAYDLNLDTLDMHASDTFHRFDRFNLKYNPCGQPDLREIFLKTDNRIHGRYLAELTAEVEKDMGDTKYSLAEWRISIYGRKRNEWATLARWWHDNHLSCPQVRWLVQVPRIYNIYRKLGLVSSFQQLLDNIFLPLFEVRAAYCKPASQQAHTQPADLKPFLLLLQSAGDR
jgi:AMP deaminase